VVVVGKRIVIVVGLEDPFRRQIEAHLVHRRLLVVALSA